MDIIIPVLVFIFGAIIGSFLNVVILRFNTGVSIGGRSHCLSCGHNLTWIELIPILSFLIQGGACKNCKSKISLQYPLVELATAVIFTLIYIYYPPLTLYLGIKFLLYLIISSLLIVMSAYDIRHKIIPDQFVYSFAVIALVNIFIGSQTLFILPSITSILAGPILAIPFALIWWLSKGTWMGLGDAKLVIGIGWLLGIGGGINSIILSFWIGAVVSVFYLLVVYKKLKPKTEIPFGPYLILGMYIVFFWKVQVIDLGLLKEVILSLL